MIFLVIYDEIFSNLKNMLDFIEIIVYFLAIQITKVSPKLNIHNIEGGYVIQDFGFYFQNICKNLSKRRRLR